MYASVIFFNNKEESFVVWIGTVIRPMNVEESEYIFYDGEPIIEMYFMVKGKAAYVLRRYFNKPYIDIE